MRYDNQYLVGGVVAMTMTWWVVSHSVSYDMQYLVGGVVDMNIIV